MKYPALTCFLVFSSLSALFGQTVKIVDQTLNAGKVEWLTQQVNTGKIPYGVPSTHEYVVRNISGDDLVIREVRPTCHCTATDWTKTPIAPGETGTIRITFDALKEGDFYKIVKVYTNFDFENCVALVLRGTVEAKKE